MNLALVKSELDNLPSICGKTLNSVPGGFPPTLGAILTLILILGWLDCVS